MENFMMIEGKRIELSDETVENLKREFVKKEDRFLTLRQCIDPTNEFQIFKGIARGIIQIGVHAAPDELRNKCLVVQEGYTPRIEKNSDTMYPFYITFEKDK